EPEEGLRSGQEIVALPQNQIKVLPRDRRKVQARCQRNGACGDTAVGAVRAHHPCDIHSGRANRRHQGEIIRRDVSARQQREQQQSRARAGRRWRRACTRFCKAVTIPCSRRENEIRPASRTPGASATAETFACASSLSRPCKWMAAIITSPRVNRRSPALLPSGRLARPQPLSRKANSSKRS